MILINVRSPGTKEDQEKRYNSSPSEKKEACFTYSQPDKRDMTQSNTRWDLQRNVGDSGMLLFGQTTTQSKQAVLSTNQEQTHDQSSLGFYTFSRTWHCLSAFSSSSDWFVALCAFAVIDQTQFLWLWCNNSHWKAIYL